MEPSTAMKSAVSNAPMPGRLRTGGGVRVDGKTGGDLLLEFSLLQQHGEGLGGEFLDQP